MLHDVRSQQLESAHRGGRGRRARPVDEAEVADEIERDLDREIGARLLEMLAALNDQRRTGG